MRAERIDDKGLHYQSSRAIQYVDVKLLLVNSCAYNKIKCKMNVSCQLNLPLDVSLRHINAYFSCSSKTEIISMNTKVNPASHN